MTIHKEGFKTIVVCVIAFVIVNLLSFQFISASAASWIVFFVTLVLLLFVVSFFRIPRRLLTIDDGKIISPCDGKVVVIEEAFDEEYFNEKRLQISIFMSPANVHVNRNAVSGEVVYSKYHKGKYLVAWHPKSSTENERHCVVIRQNEVEVMIKQIAGAVAKRIVNYLQVGQQVKQAAEMGFIKFGSRVDLLLPVGTEVNISLNQMVKGGLTVIATL